MDKQTLAREIRLTLDGIPCAVCEERLIDYILSLKEKWETETINECFNEVEPNIRQEERLRAKGIVEQQFRLYIDNRKIRDMLTRIQQQIMGE